MYGGDGDNMLDLSAVAGPGGLSPYELLTGLRQRAECVYVREAP